MDAVTVGLTAVVAITVLLVPGGAAGVILGFRGIAVLGVAAPLSLAGIALFSLIEIVVPLPWTPLTWVLSSALVVVIAILLRWLLRRRQQWVRNPATSRVAAAAPFVAVAIAAIAIVARLVPIMGGEEISQTFDNIYHLNAVRYILDTGLIGPTHQIIPGFYPSLWHALTATVAMISGASVPLAVNITSIAIAAIVWPASVVFLTRQIAGANTTALLTSGVLAAAMAGFPLLMLDHGVLYPNVLSIALLPAVIALLLQVTGTGDGERAPAVIRVLLLLVALVVLALAHPSTLMAFFAIGIWPALHAGVRWIRVSRGRESRSRLVGGLVLWTFGLAAVAALLIKARPTSEQAFWPPSLSFTDAIMQVVLNEAGWKPASIVVSITTLLGVVTILTLRRRWWWLVAGWTTIAALFIVCASFPAGLFRYGLTGTWYSDLFRIVALMPTMAAPLGAIGVAFTVSAVLGLFRAQGERLVTAVGAVVAALILVLTQSGAQLAAETANTAAVYRLTDKSPLLTSAEAALIDRLPEHVDPDEVIAGSPWTGTALSYALADRAALIPHIYQEITPDIALLSARLNDAERSPDVCAALERTGVRWVLDFGSAEVHSATHPYPGFEGLDRAPGFELVDSEGPEARLYRIAACDD